MIYGWYKGFSRAILSLYDACIRCWLQNLKISPLTCDSCLQSFLQHERLVFLFGWKFLDSSTFSSLVLLPLERELSPSGLECPIDSHPWPASHHRAVSLWWTIGRERWGLGLAFLLTSQMTWVCKAQYHPFHLGLWKQWSPWAHHICPEFLNFISSPISCVATYTSAQVHGKWSVSVNDFFIYVRERPIRQIQWDKFREFVSSRHFQVSLCSGAQTQNRFVKKGSFFWKKFISMGRHRWWVKNIKTPALQPENSTGSWKELSVNKFK